MSATQLNAGHVGQAFLVQREGNTDVTVQVSGVPDSVTRPVHLHTYIHQGSCASLAPRPAYSLTSRVLANRDIDGFLTLRNTAPVSLDTLRASAHALVVRSDAADANKLLFCGDLRSG